MLSLSAMPRLGFDLEQHVRTFGVLRTRKLLHNMRSITHASEHILFNVDRMY
jgi:hypothetical protein